MSTQLRYAYKRHNTWIYRRTYPKRLQHLLGSALKQSLRTSDARTAKNRVTELNETFTSIVAEADAKLAMLGGERDQHPISLKADLPRYCRVHLTGRTKIADLCEQHLKEVSPRLRPGSFKSVRYAMDLFSSQFGHLSIADIESDLGRDTLKHIRTLSPNVRKYRAAKGLKLSDLAKLSQELEETSLTPQTQHRIWDQMSSFLDWCVASGELQENPWSSLEVGEPPEPEPYKVLTDKQVELLLQTKDRVLKGALLFGLLTGMRSGEVAGLRAEELVRKGNLGCFVKVVPNEIRLLKSRAAEREVPLHSRLEMLVEQSLPTRGRLFPSLNVDRIVKGYAKLRRLHPGLRGTVFHGTRKWFITQCERTGVPEHYTASLVGHQSARSANKLTYGLYSAGISDAQKREIIDQISLPEAVGV